MWVVYRPYLPGELDFLSLFDPASPHISHLYRGRGTGRDIPLSTSAHLIWVVNAPDDWPCTSHHLVDEADNPYLLLSIPPVQSIG